MQPKTATSASGQHLPYEARHIDDIEWETIRWPGETGKMLFHPRPERPTEPNAGILRLEPGAHHPIHNHVLDAVGVLVRVFKSRPVNHSAGIENRNIRFLASGNPAAIGDTQLFSIEQGHLIDSLFQAQDVLFPHVLAQDAWECPIPTRVRSAATQDSIGPNGFPV